MSATAIVTTKGTSRWLQGHPWIFRTDVRDRPSVPAGVVRVCDVRNADLGWALWSPTSEISLRLLDRDPTARIDAAWWHTQLRAAVARRSVLRADTNAFRLVHGEGDGLPSLVVDQYDRWLVVQLLSAGLEACRGDIIAALESIVAPAGILARHDASVRTREGLSKEIELLAGTVPDVIEVNEHGVRYLAAPRDGQKTGAFLDQRENRVAIGALAHGKALDCFAYHGSFALHLARRATSVKAVDISAAALARVGEHAALNGFTNIEPVEADAFEFLRAEERAGAQYDTIVVDPPAFAKNKQSVGAALRGYHEINLRAMRLLAPGGVLLSASCSYHVTKPLFWEMLQRAAADAQGRFTLRALTGQPLDHPELLTVPETGYLKGAVVVREAREAREAREGTRGG
jgi:23S rRNA (cytosine1962-C5)-methyltransferase